MMRINHADLFLFYAFASILFISCTQETKKVDYAAKVNDAYLTKDELELLIDSSANENQKNEIIRNWILKEILYQQAKKEGLVDSNLFKIKAEISKKELAGAMLLRNYSDAQKIDVPDASLLDYYNKNQNDFRLSFNAYYLNLIRFDDYEKAVQFRTFLLENNWEKAVAQFQTDRSVIRVRSAVTINEQDLYPQKLAKIVQALQPLEISIVISEASGYHTVVQVLEKFPKDIIPPLYAIRDDVVERYKAERLKNLINKYLAELYSQNQIDINY